MAERTVLFHVGHSTHALFREQLRAAPAGFAYRTTDPEREEAAAATRRIAAQDRRSDRLRRGAEWAAIRSLSQAGFVRARRVGPPPGTALVHSAQFLLADSPLPYVVDFECIEAFTLYQRVALGRPWARSRLSRAFEDQRLRFLLPWSDAARRGLQAALGSDVASRLAPKVETVLPAIRPVAGRPREREPGAPLRVLFIGTAFLAKGGAEALDALARVRETHDVRLDMVSDVPGRWHERVARADGLTLHSWPAGREVVQSLFERSDALLFPSHMDTLGFVMLEAMAHGMPVLAARHFATPEIVEHDVSGLLFAGENGLYGEDGLCRFPRTLPPPRAFRAALAHPSEAYVERIARCLARLAEDDALHGRLAAGAFERARSGPLSIERRRAALGRIYDLAAS